MEIPYQYTNNSDKTPEIKIIRASWPERGWELGGEGFGVDTLGPDKESVLA